MINMNKVFLCGRVVNGPTARTTADGLVAVTLLLELRSRRSADGESRKDTVSVTAIGKTAEMLRDNVRIDDNLMVQGRMRHEQWITEAGEKRDMVRVACDVYGLVTTAFEEDIEPEELANTLKQTA